MVGRRSGQSQRSSHYSDAVLTFAIDALATYRLTRLLIEDEILRGPRVAILDRLDPDTDGPERPGDESKLAYFLQCPWCVSPYVAILVMCLNLTGPGRLINRVLAMSAVAGLISENG